MLYYGMKCPFCENLIEKDDDIVICSACKTVHHKDCWKANNGCTTYACKGEKYTIEEYEESINPRPVTPIQRPKPEDLQIKKGQGDHFAGFYNKPYSAYESNFTSASDEKNDLLSEKISMENEEPEEDKTEVKETETPSMLNKCLKCGAEVSDVDIKCPVCGCPLVEEEEAIEIKLDNNKPVKENKQKKKNKKEKSGKQIRWEIIIPLSIAFIVVSSITGFYLFNYVTAIKKATNHYYVSAQKNIKRLPIISLHDNNLVLYVEAGCLYEDGNLKDATKAFFDLGDYRDSYDMSEKCALDYAQELDDSRKYEDEISWYEYVRDNYAFEMHYVDITYDIKQKLKGQVAEKDAEANAEIERQIQEIEDRAIRPVLNFTNAKIGDTVQFGRYEQDGKELNGKENIDWTILDYKNNKALLISKYALDYQQYNNSKDSHVLASWKDCSLREWLNNEFINKAFTPQEQSIISTESINSYCSFFGPNIVTDDKIFCLSVEEAIACTDARQYKKVAPSSGYYSYMLMCEPTEYVIKKGAILDSIDSTEWKNLYGLYMKYPSSACKLNSTMWWLRDNGENMFAADGACVVYANGSAGRDMITDLNEYLAVRPAMWVYCDKKIENNNTYDDYEEDSWDDNEDDAWIGYYDSGDYDYEDDYDYYDEYYDYDEDYGYDDDGWN